MAVFRDWVIESYQWAGIKDGVEVRKCPVLIILDPPPGCLSLYRRQSINTNKWHCYNAACSVTMTVPVGGGHPRYTSALRAGETHFDRHVPLCHDKAAAQMSVIEAERHVEALARACGVARALHLPKPSWVNWLREGHDFILYPQPAFKTVQTRFGPLVKEEERVMLDTVPRPSSPLPSHVRYWVRNGLWAYPPRNAARAEPVVVDEVEDMEASDSDSAGSNAGSDEAEVSDASEAVSGGAEVGGVAFVYGPDDTPASPPEADRGPIIPTVPLYVPFGEDSDSSSGRSVASGDLEVSD